MIDEQKVISRTLIHKDLPKLLCVVNNWTCEKDFANWFLAKEKDCGRMSVRIESRATRTGVPDAFVVGVYGTSWYEFKFLPKASIHDKKWKIPWRPGQKAFALQYYMASRNTDFIVTVVGMRDGYIVISMLPDICCRENNTIYREEVNIRNGKD